MAAASLNFIRAVARPSPTMLALLAVLALALVASGARSMAQWRNVSRLESELARVQPVAAFVQPLSAAARQQQEQQVKIVGEAVRQLNVPVTRLIKMVQAPNDVHIALLALDLNGKGESDAKAPSGTLKIGAEAQSPQDMMNYVAFLSEQPLFASVYLVKHEQAGSAYRFQVEAQWKQ
jgi:hypothetical protein